MNELFAWPNGYLEILCFLNDKHKNAEIENAKH